MPRKFVINDKMTKNTIINFFVHFVFNRNRYEFQVQIGTYHYTFKVVLIR